MILVILSNYILVFYNIKLTRIIRYIFIFILIKTKNILYINSNTLTTLLSFNFLSFILVVLSKIKSIIDLRYLNLLVNNIYLSVLFIIKLLSSDTKLYIR